MADWVKMRTDLYRDPKVILIAEDLLRPDSDLAKYVGQQCHRDMTVTRNVTRNVTVGALVTVWGVVRVQGCRFDDDVFIENASLSMIDDLSEIPGFGEAMAAVGWAEEVDNGLKFPGFFAEHNVDPGEKTKQKNAERQAKYREKKKRDSNVTRNVTRNVTITHREEGEKSISSSAATPPTAKSPEIPVNEENAKFTALEAISVQNVQTPEAAIDVATVSKPVALNGQHFDPSKPIYRLPAAGGEFFEVTQDMVDGWERAFEKVNVHEQLGRAEVYWPLDQSRCAAPKSDQGKLVYAWLRGASEHPKTTTKVNIKTTSEPVDSADPLIAAIIEITGSDPLLNSSDIRAAAIEIAMADPPYSPDDIRSFGKRFTELCPWANDRMRPTVAECRKFLYMVRQPVKPATGGHRVEPQAGKYEKLAHRFRRAE